MLKILESRKNCCCPICGYEFEPVEAINVCPEQHGEFVPEQLINEYADYEELML